MHCRQRKADAAEAARKAEEELMEARRRELLSQEDGYWRHRMAQEAAAAALAQEALARVPSPVRALAACGKPLGWRVTFMQ